jgi:DNA-binding transcriptional regulator YiaG
MPDFKQTFQDEVRRLARKELKAFEAKINEQKKTISALTKRVHELEKKQASAPAAVKSAAESVQSAAPAADGRKARFSPKSLVKFRKKYTLSQKALAVLLGVTPFTVSHWEIGKNRPRTNQIEAFSALAKLGKRKVLALVAEKAPGELPAPKKAAPKKSAKAAKKEVKKAEKKVEKKAAAPAKRGRKAKAVKAAKAAAPAEKKA